MREMIHINLICGFYKQEEESGAEPNNTVRRYFGLEDLASEEFWAEQGFAVVAKEDEVPV